MHPANLEAEAKKRAKQVLDFCSAITKTIVVSDSSMIELLQLQIQMVYVEGVQRGILLIQDQIKQPKGGETDGEDQRPTGDQAQA